MARVSEYPLHIQTHTLARLLPLTAEETAAETAEDPIKLNKYTQTHTQIHPPTQTHTAWKHAGTTQIHIHTNIHYTNSN